MPNVMDVTNLTKQGSGPVERSVMDRRLPAKSCWRWSRASIALLLRSFAVITSAQEPAQLDSLIDSKRSAQNPAGPRWIPVTIAKPSELAAQQTVASPLVSTPVELIPQTVRQAAPSQRSSSTDQTDRQSRSTLLLEPVLIEPLGGTTASLPKPASVNPRSATHATLAAHQTTREAEQELERTKRSPKRGPFGARGNTLVNQPIANPPITTAVHRLSKPDPYETLPMVTPRVSAQRHLDSVRGRVAQWHLSDQNFNELHKPVKLSPAAAPTDVRAWWDEEINRPIGFSDQQLLVDVGSLTVSALSNSPRIQSILDEPKIQQSAVTIADAEFDSRLFLETQFADGNDPVGNQLTTGNADRRFRNEEFTASAALQRRLRNGGNFEMLQRGGFQENNSEFLLPNPQGTTRLELNYSQPLLQGRGEQVNRYQVLIAQFRAYQAGSEARLELEDHLKEVTSAYWNLYRYRARYLQQRKLVGKTIDLYEVIKSRQAFDAGKRQLVRAKAEVARRQAGLVRAASRIQDAQSRLRMLVGYSGIPTTAPVEWTTSELPNTQPFEVDLKQSVYEALEHRGDISGVLQEIQEVSARVGLARNQVLPQLDLLLGTYVAGLEEGRDTWGAFENQFSDGRPGYSVALTYELPIGNRAARSRLNRSRWELHQVMETFKQTTESAITEVELAARETNTAYQDLVEKKLAVDAMQAEVDYLTQRYQELPAQEDSLVSLVDSLLDAQDRLAAAESEFLESQIAYAMSWVNLRKATGTLLRFEEHAAHEAQPFVKSSTTEDETPPRAAAIENSQGF